MVSKNERISIIVPVYNVEKYLKQCLNSLLNQTYKNVEIIMVDDGSKDSSGKICEDYAKQYSNFKVIHKENAGLGMARNTGLSYATGEYVTFVDSDDWLEQDTIKQLYDGMKKYNVDFCKDGFQRITNEKRIINRVKYAETLYEGDDAKKVLLPRMVGSSPSQHDSVEMCVCGVLYKLSIIKEHNLKFPSEREMISEDLVFNIEYLQYANGGCLISFCGYNYRLNPVSLTSSYRKDRFDAVLFFYQEIRKMLKEYGYQEETIIRLQRLFFVYIRMCIAQETKKVSGLKMEANVKNIEKICLHNCVKRIIKNYPKREIGIKQRFFLYLVEHNYAKVLYWLARIKIV